MNKWNTIIKMRPAMWGGGNKSKKDQQKNLETQKTIFTLWALFPHNLVIWCRHMIGGIKLTR